MPGWSALISHGFSGSSFTFQPKIISSEPGWSWAPKRCFPAAVWGKVRRFLDIWTPKPSLAHFPIVTVSPPANIKERTFCNLNLTPRSLRRPANPV